jgi:hypothetical protein
VETHLLEQVAPGNDPTGTVINQRLGEFLRWLSARPIELSRSLTVQEYVSRFRQASVRSQLPGEFLDQTVEQALRSGNSTVRKLLVSGEYAK